jgi:acetoin utilization protein AcuB
MPTESATAIEVREIMTSNPISLDASSTVHDVAKAMLENDIRHMPIVKDQTLVGIISDRDIKELYLSRSTQESPLGIVVDEILESYVLFVAPTAPVSDVIDLMVDHKVGAIPVVDERSNKLVGIVSYIDVLKMANEYL